MNFLRDTRGKCRTCIAEACPHFPAVAADNFKSTCGFSPLVFRPPFTSGALRAYLPKKISSFGTWSLASNSVGIFLPTVLCREATEIYASTMGFVGLLVFERISGSKPFSHFPGKSFSTDVTGIRRPYDWFFRATDERETIQKVETGFRIQGYVHK